MTTRSSLPFSHHDDPVTKIHILDAQRQSLADAHAGSVEQLSNQQVLVGKPGQHRTHLFTGQDHR